ncbi:MAG: cupin domain-containing protein [Candidatus Latescibacteria bacterium]|nr:cupin domain-containing protein [Candidatus Latescibacterota bacterium]
MVIKKSQAFNITKRDVNMWIYNGKAECRHAAVVYQETVKGHAEEFYHSKSAFIFYIIEGSGTWIIEGKEFPVETTDVVIIPPRKKFYYKGNLKQICITTPSWEERFEHHVRDVEL